ncbi:MAG: orotidine-5'-phosphate decarboxylase [Candidatus Zixiibacteriota bacterium]|nr:MAG: orotidine-5'-phosphate decarboxylase [candidate division Zixibacteria bacterium]
MSAVEKLEEIQGKNKSIICLGLDLDPRRMPTEFTKSIKGMYDFVMEIVEATKDMVCAYKPNLAFYENKGAEGISLLTSIAEHMPEEVVVILDGKRGDIGNTASFYAEAMYQKWKADWVTLSPYMGYDSMRPFLEYEDKGIFVLCLTSNTGSKDFQHLVVEGKPLYQVVAEKVAYWNKDNNCGLVVGATQPEHLKGLRSIAQNMPLLIPGVGAQGGSLEKAAVYGTDNFKKLAVINVCRSVLYASNGPDFAQRAREELKKLNDTVAGLRSGEITLDAPPPPEVEESEPAVEEPPKKEWKLPPIPDLPFMKKKPEQPQEPQGDQSGNQGEQSRDQDYQRQDNRQRDFRGRNNRDDRHGRHQNRPWRRDG